MKVELIGHLYKYKIKIIMYLTFPGVYVER